MLKKIIYKNLIENVLFSFAALLQDKLIFSVIYRKWGFPKHTSENFIKLILLLPYGIDNNMHRFTIQQKKCSVEKFLRKVVNCIKMS